MSFLTAASDRSSSGSGLSGVSGTSLSGAPSLESLIFSFANALVLLAMPFSSRSPTLRERTTFHVLFRAAACADTQKGQHHLRCHPIRPPQCGRKRLKLQLTLLTANSPRLYSRRHPTTAPPKCGPIAPQNPRSRPRYRRRPRDEPLRLA